MDDFEIRIITPDLRAWHVFTTSLSGEGAAIRRAEVLAGSRRGAQVWRDGVCIHAVHHGRALSLLPRAAETMQAVYEIRILRDDLKPSLIWKCLPQNDAAAIRAGVSAADGQAVEIWRDHDCIFRGGRRDKPAA
jgi:hypothetical protein